jgi:hypothetical protein
VLIDLTDHPPLLPGMRVDVFLSEDSQPGAAGGGIGPAAKAN